MGRHPIGDKALTQGERHKRSRANKARREAKRDEALRQIRDEAETIKQARQIARDAMEFDDE